MFVWPLLCFLPHRPPSSRHPARHRHPQTPRRKQLRLLPRRMVNGGTTTGIWPARATRLLMGSRLPTDQRSEVEMALAGMESALFTEDPRKGTGELDKLKEAMKVLDTATQSLATLMLETAMQQKV